MCGPEAAKEADLYLKQIELQGFKSFPDRTKLTFEKGATVVVGPNGSGKSNISDAMRWVLGEISSKSLRGTKMEDIIFGGSDSRKPMTYAEVSVTFDNSGEYGRIDVPYDEITVTRRYHRGGESEYFINRREVRLRDIYEMFLNTGIGRNGYSIIEQGRIAEIISKKSDDRREIFEDAAGIAKYRHTKNEAERKLEAANLNTERVRDALNIMQGHLASLQRESVRAKRFVEYSEIKKEADVRLWLYDTEKFRRDIASSEAEGSTADRELEENAEELAGLSSQQDRLEQLGSESRREAAALIEKIREKTGENHELDSEIRVTRTQISHLEEAAASAAADAEGLLAEAAAEDESAAQKDENAESLSASIGDMTLEEKKARDGAAAAAAEADDLAAKIAEAFDEVSACRAELSDTEARIEMLGKSGSEEETRGESVKRELNERERAADAHEAECRDSEEKIRQYEIRLLTLESNLSSAGAEQTRVSEKLDKLNSEIQSLEVAKETLGGKIEALRRMEEHFEGYVNSVRTVMRAVKDGSLSTSGRVYGPVSSIISVDGRYVTAVETALGQSIQNIVVEVEQTAHDCIYYLRRAGAGVATFYPLTSVRGYAPTREMEAAASFPGYVGIASDLCTADSKFRSILTSMLGRTVVFDNLENATAMAKKGGYTVRAVTLDGQIINRGGSFTGGSVRTGSGILTRADDIKRMEGDLRATAAKIEKLTGDAEKVGVQLDEVTSRIRNDDGERQLIEKLAAVERAKLEKQRESLASDRELLEKFRADIASSASEKAARDSECDQLKARRRELENRASELDAFRFDADSRRSDAVSRREKLNEEVNAITVKISETRRDIESLKQMASMSREKAASLRADSERKKTESELAAVNLENMRKHLEDCLSDFAEGNREIEEFNSVRAGHEKTGLEYEQKLNEIRRLISDRQSRRDVLQSRKLSAETALASLRSQLDAMTDKFWEDHGMTRAEAVECSYPPLTAEERPAVLALQTEYRNKIRNIGNCDPASIEEYEKEKERYDELCAQLADLDKTRAELEKVIASIEADMKKIFAGAFDSINENFKQTFSELFGGGTAELILTDPENILESGIEIKVAPPGKIIKSLMQLSGGEQSFVAIALFFAILRVNPTPFCIFDEIEAALDEVNVERFAQYVRRYSESTQLIIITHRRGTMNAADRLYGVTMPESGISKVLELNVAEIAEKKGELWNELS